MRTLTPLILSAIVVLTPLLMVPVARADETTLKVQVIVDIQGALGLVGDQNVELLLQAVASGIEEMLEGGAWNGRFITFDPGVTTDDVTGHDWHHGSVQGNVVFLSGVVTQSTDLDFLQTPVEVKADGDTGEIAFILGPVSGGSRAGQTFVFAGTGTVTITKICLLKIPPCIS